MISVASVLQRGAVYVLQTLNIIHDDPEDIICIHKCFHTRYQPLKSIQCRYGVYFLSQQTYVGKPVFLYFIRQRKKSNHWHKFRLTA
jgi:hypothetical protein